MKGAKGGNRDRIISWLFSERTRKIREGEEELKQTEQNKIEEKQNERRTKNKKEEEFSEVVQVVEANETLEYDETIEHENFNTPEKEIIKSADEISTITTIPIITKEEENELEEKTSDIEDEIVYTVDLDADNKKPPTLFIDEEIIEEIKEQNLKREKEEPEDNLEVNSFFPEVDEVSIDESQQVENIEKPELIQISVIEEIDNLLKNDAYDLRDIKYRIEVLNQQEKDEVLLENIEKIQKELEDLIKRFNEIKKKYEYAYSNISVKDIDMINDLDLGLSISDYIINGKNGIDNSTTLDQIHEIEEFIDIINNIIEIEKQKDIVQESIDGKLIDYSIRDEEFIQLQDDYADIEDINKLIEKYNIEMDSIFADLDVKIANSTEITRTIENSFSIVPDINRMINATILLASAEMIPPTPLGNLFRVSLFVSAAHMMATAFTPQTQEREIIRTTVTDYSKDIINSKATIYDVLGNIEDAFSKINYMKETFEKEFSQYSSQIPEYDELIKNIFAVEKELERQQTIAYDYSSKFDHALSINNQKVKTLENE